MRSDVTLIQKNGRLGRKPTFQSSALDRSDQFTSIRSPPAPHGTQRDRLVQSHVTACIVPTSDAVHTARPDERPGVINGTAAFDPRREAQDENLTLRRHDRLAHVVPRRDPSRVAHHPELRRQTRGYHPGLELNPERP